MIVAVLNQKGDCGKTTLSLHLGGAWARSGKVVIQGYKMDGSLV
jgi:cellulose biosynthesis protein BcsQ